ncbi:short-chain dehydrogenase [Aspergillus cavernicola]|uniref:Short-chain dehydrogenase n=1 Tax=Aspergillus cavernicola TaxID=176166 RepID=A0ABR4I5J4_9EURO
MAQFKAEALFSIPGRTAIITGGGSGLGRICAKTFLTNGASVTIIDMEAPRLSSVKTELSQLKKDLALPGQIHTIHGDLSSKPALETVTSQLLALHKTTGIDILVHCAGIRRQNKISYAPGDPLSKLAAATASLPYEDLEASFRINLFAQYYLTAGLVEVLGAAAKRGGGRGCVICFSSVASKHNGQFVPAYQMSKAAVDHLVRIMAAEFAGFYIRVNAISPGIFPSSLNPADPTHPESNMSFAQEMPARRAGSEEEMAGTALYLVSPAGGYMTGDNMHVDGGRLLVAAAKISKL